MLIIKYQHDLSFLCVCPKAQQWTTKKIGAKFGVAPGTTHSLHCSEWEPLILYERFKMTTEWWEAKKVILKPLYIHEQEE
jgi:hypothetical protein